MKVLQATDNLQIGGVQRVTVDLANCLTELGDEVTVFAAEGGLAVDLDARVRFLKPLRFGWRLVDKFVAHAQLALLVATDEFDVVHSHQRGVALSVLLSRRFTRRRFLTVEHVHNVFKAGRLARLLSFRSDQIIACGSVVYQMIVGPFGRGQQSTHLVNNGTRDQQALLGEEIHSTASVRRIVAVARAHPQKDPLRFVRIAKIAKADHSVSDLNFEWIGGGELEADARSEAQTINGSVVSFVGEVPAATPYMAGAALLLLTSRQEGLPLVAIEALSLGVPVVLPDVGSCRDLFTAAGPLEIGVLYPPGIADDQLAELLVRVCSDGTAARWSLNAREVWSSCFEQSRVVSEVRRIYQTAAEV